MEASIPTPVEGAADLVLCNARVWTVDQRLPEAEAVAIKGNEILAVGNDEAIAPLIGPSTWVVDLAGQLVIPGFNDAHTHFVGAALRAATAFDLYGVTTLQDVGRRLKTHAERHAGAGWLAGWRWDSSRFESQGWPTRLDLDAFEPDRPVAIFDIDGHSCWTNTAALSALGYSADTPDPQGGQILREASGHPTGILLETAHDPIPRSASVSADAFGLLLAQEVAKVNRLGITSLSNNGVRPEHFEVYARMAAEGALKLRISEWAFLDGGLSAGLSAAGGLAEAQDLRARFRANERVRVVGLKVLLDGVLSAHTAWMLEPYADAPDQVGFPILEPDDLLQKAARADALGFQILVHAVGDRAVRETLDVYEQVARINGRRDSRHRIEHVEVAHPRDQQRFAKLGVIPCMTPVHCTACIEDYVDDRLGEPRARHAYPWRSFVDTGAHLCFGTDWPAVDLAAPDPLQQIFAAVTRATPQAFGRLAWHPEQRLSVADAIRCYTLESAYAEFMEGRKGSITPGKLADLCVLSEDILRAPPEQILETEVTMTVFDGEVVYVKE
jgi:predicted amidohydrolase YtcJ